MTADSRVDRRAFLRRLAGGAVGALAWPIAARAAEPAAGRPPNFVIFLADDHGHRDAGCYGSTVVRTPHMDRLAAEGLRFTNAFAATAMCAPSRSTLYTGLYPLRHGAHPNHSQVKPGTRSLPHYLGELGYAVGLAGKKHIGPAECFPFAYTDMKGAEKFLRENRDRPFCLVVATHYPHGPWAKTGAIAPANVQFPPGVVDTPETRARAADYLGDVELLDAELGSYLDLLKKYQLEDNTLFIYASDHGWGFPFGKWTCYDMGLRVPFLVRWPGRVKPGTVTEALISFVDVLPTFIEAAGGAPRADLDGRSFLPVLRGQAAEHNDIIYAAHTTRGIKYGSDCYPIRAVRTRTHKYIRNLCPDAAFTNVIIDDRSGQNAWWQSWQEKAKTDPLAAERVRAYQHRPAEELYDLRADPYELKNLTGDPAQTALLADLRRRLDDWMTQQGDCGAEAERAVKIHPTARGEKDDG